MKLVRTSLVLGVAWLIWACGASEEDALVEDVSEIEQGIMKGFPGAMNGQYNYCYNPAALCVSGEGDCNSNSQCVAPLVCGRDNGGKFGFAIGSDVCIPAHCQNKRIDAGLGETQIDCGGPCGSVCPGVACPPNANGSIGHCTTDCRCPSGEGDCNTSAECQAGLICGIDNGPQFGMPAGYDVCVVDACNNNQLDAPNETGIDCGGTCGSCPSAFFALGDLAGGTTFSEPNALSNNGLVVVGVSNSTNGVEAFRWTQTGGMVGLGDLTGGVFNSVAYGVSSNGSVVVGTGRSDSGTEAFRWTSGGMVGLGDLAGGSFKSEGWGLNAGDGSILVGPSTSANGAEAFIWTSGGGMVGLGDLADGTFNSRAYATNSNGAIIVGRGTSANGVEAFRWTAGGLQALGDLAGGSFASVALGISSQGSVIVGYGTTASGTQAFRWTASGGMVALPLLAGTTTSFAQGTSADGAVVVGTATGAGNTPFVWTQSDNTSRSIATVLADAGVSLTGWTLETAVAISPDGKWVIGRGTNPTGDTEGWLAQLP
jgi:probable HAF family extracellular repeat protein